MDLTGTDGTRLTLRPVAYQFPELERSPDPRMGDWDPHWLIIEGSLHLADGRAHSFRDQCLTTWEAGQLGRWLAAVADGQPPSPVSDEPELTFVEPCLAFDLEVTDPDTVTIRAYLSLEFEPPFTVSGERGIYTHYVPLSMPRPALAAAAAQWRSDLEPFPKRG